MALPYSDHDMSSKFPQKLELSIWASLYMSPKTCFRYVLESGSDHALLARSLTYLRVDSSILDSFDIPKALSFDQTSSDQFKILDASVIDSSVVSAHLTTHQD